MDLRSSSSKMIVRVKANPMRYVGLAILAVFLAISLFAEALAPYDPEARMGAFRDPSWEHILGTNDLGNDIFSEVVYATRISLGVGLLSACIALTIGVTIGVLAGYYRGWAEQLLLGLTDTALLVPALPFTIVLVAYIEPNIWVISAAIASLGWCSTARVLHPRVMELKDSNFVLYVRSLGKRDLYIITKHIIPNAWEIISVKFSLAVGTGMLAEASLSFLGLSDPSNQSWGGIINKAFTRGGLAMDLWWWYIVPGLLIGLMILAFMMISNVERDKGVLLD
ncbi:MAG: ABC transporter permease [Methanomassiliicoccales archaeon]|nr:ABC transporter permease [Methanomassiliicoccales archaeon]